MITYVVAHNTLHDQLAEIQNELQIHKWGYIHKVILDYPKDSIFWNVTYHEDDEGKEFALVCEPDLPTDVYAEIEGETYGELTGWRVYK